VKDAEAEEHKYDEHNDNAEQTIEENGNVLQRCSSSDGVSVFLDSERNTVEKTSVDET